MSYDLIKYEKLLGTKRTRYRVKDSGDEFKTLWQLSAETGTKPSVLSRRMRKGRPLNVVANARLVVGGPRDGEWITTGEISRWIDATCWWINQHC